MYVCSQLLWPVLYFVVYIVRNTEDLFIELRNLDDWEFTFVLILAISSEVWTLPFSITLPHGVVSGRVVTPYTIRLFIWITGKLLLFPLILILRLLQYWPQIILKYSNAGILHRVIIIKVNWIFHKRWRHSLNHLMGKRFAPWFIVSNLCLWCILSLDFLVKCMECMFTPFVFVLYWGNILLLKTRHQLCTINP